MTIYKLDYETKGIVFELQRFSLHDGPGIRTIVFLKGCPLACQWCSNPESQVPKPQLMYIANNCIGCRKCLSACPTEAINFNHPFPIDYNRCITCGKCAAICYSGALNMAGSIMTVGDVLTELKKDSNHYRRSGGGITLSGGEPLIQSEFTEQLLKGCKANGWHTAIETTAYTDENTLKRVLPWLDLFLMDIKHMDPNKHRQHTGKTNELILENAKIISQSNVKMIVRVPIIPEFNDNVDDIQAITDFARKLKVVEEVHLLPYHRLGQNKYGYLGSKYQMEKFEPLRNNSIIHLKKVVEDFGLLCKIGGIR